LSPAARSTFLRWCRFNAVGAIGMALQLAALSFFNRMWTGRYLLASAAAVEVALLHNFALHLRYTWRDRRAGIAAQLARFHLANGAVSLLGNLVLMRVLVSVAHLRILIANAIAILCCSLLNFLLGDRWAFAARFTAAAESSLR